VAAAVVTGIAAASAVGGSIDATTTCEPQGTIQANEWNSSAPQCVTYTSGTAWSMSTAKVLINDTVSRTAPARR
jgi:cellulose 1,4-beta-cellobiosidase